MDLNDLWIDVTQTQPNYNKHVILSLRRGNGGGAVVQGYRDFTDSQGDHYVIPSWDTQLAEALAPRPIAYSNEKWYVEAWQNFPLLFNSRTLSP